MTGCRMDLKTSPARGQPCSPVIPYSQPDVYQE